MASRKDYTDGGGWARLDATSARALAETMSAFTGRTADKRRHMLLWCFSKLNSGKPPYFRVGSRSIAKACGYTRKAARTFLDFMESEGYFVTVEKGDEGHFDKRTFWWFTDGTGPLEGPSPGPKPRSEGPGWRAPEPEPCGPHQSTEYSESNEYSLLSNYYPEPAPAPAPADAGPGGGELYFPDDYDPFFPDKGKIVPPPMGDA